MDDLYQNAWTETADAPTPATFKTDSTTTWSPPSKLTSAFDEEADLAAPSWSTGAGISWNEPSTPGFSWSQTEADAGWGPSTYEGISFSKASVDLDATANVLADPKPAAIISDPEPVDDAEVTVPSPSSTPGLPSSPFQAPSPTFPEPVSTHVFEVTIEPVAPPSPDGFGSFESGLPEEVPTSPAFAIVDEEVNAWGSSAWTDNKSEDEVAEEPVDEWERARREKAKQDRRVPPELLTNIIRECEAVSLEIFAEPKDDSEVSDEDAWRNDRRSGIEGVPGLNSFIDSFLPPLMLEPPPRFSQTVISKKMVTSVKLTKNLPLSRLSPMSHYLSAKGSTAWEVSVKERKEAVEDDIPVGWRIVEKAPTPLAETKDKKPGGRLFSFWGRRQSQVASPASSVLGGDSDSRSSSIDKPKSPAIDDVKAQSKRPSQESVRSSAASSSTQLPSPSADPVSSTSTALAAPPPAMSSYATAPDPVPERSGTPPAPSAVSRFLGRWSKRGSIGGSPRSSLALSSDDLEFLSDIVPSAADDGDDDSLDALEKFVSTQRESTVPVLPPPLAPPPKAPPSIRPTSAAGNTPSTAANMSGSNLHALFGTSDTAGGITAPTPPSSKVGGSSIPPLAPPLVPSRPLTPSAPHGAGLSKPSIPIGTFRSQTSTPPLGGFGLPPPPAFQPIAPSTSNSKPKPKLASPFPLPRASTSKIDSGPMSASSTSSASYQTAEETSPSSPTSTLPLGELYPHLVTPSSPPQPSAQAFLRDQKPTGFPPSLATPLANTFSPSTNLPFLRSAVQSGGAVSPTAAPLASNLFDDDDFSDFQSPVDKLAVPSPPAPQPVAKSPRTLVAAQVASAALRAPMERPQTESSLSMFALPPPPAASVPAKSSSAAPQTSLASFDDDDFADFQESPMSPPSSHPSTSSSLFAGSASDRGLLTPKNSMSFNSFDDFLGGSSLATPSPPRVPAKPAPPLPLPPVRRPAVHVPPLQPPPLQPPPSQPPPLQRPPSSTTSTSPNPKPKPKPKAIPASSSNPTTLLSRRESKRKSHAAEHLHTLNLVEKAAARSGQQWPAPPSPLPAALPAPAGGLKHSSSSSVSGWDFMDDGAQDQPVAGSVVAPPSSNVPLAPSFSSPAMFNSPARPGSGTGLGLSNGSGIGIGSQALAPSSTTTSSSNSTSNLLLGSWGSSSDNSLPRMSSPPNAFGTQGKVGSAVQKSGLSAQDLSFFEGL